MSSSICYALDDSGRVVRWAIADAELAARLARDWLAQGSHLYDHPLADEPLDVWLRGEPLPLPDRVLYLLAEWVWPHEAIVALADHVYAVSRARVAPASAPRRGR